MTHDQAVNLCFKRAAEKGLNFPLHARLLQSNVVPDRYSVMVSETDSVMISETAEWNSSYLRNPFGA